MRPFRRAGTARSAHVCPRGGGHDWRMSDGRCNKCGEADPRDPKPGKLNR